MDDNILPIIETNDMMDIYDRMKHKEWSINDIKDIHELGILSINRYKSNDLIKKREMMRTHLYDVVCDIVVSYLDIQPHVNLYGMVEYETPDEKNFHERVTAQLKSWNCMRSTKNNIYADLFVSSLEHLIDEKYIIHNRAEHDLDIIHAASHSVVVSNAYPLHRRSKPQILLYHLDTNRKYPITGIGIIVCDPSHILVVIQDWCPLSLKWCAVIHKLNLHDIQTENGEDYQYVMRELNRLGRFYISGV